MKFSFLFKTPKYQRFHIVPRHYDPVKEEVEARTARIKGVLDADEGLEFNEGYSRSRINGAFASRRPKKAAVNFMQLIIVVLISAGLAGYWYYGNIALYIFLLVSSVLLYLRIKRII